MSASSLKAVAAADEALREARHDGAEERTKSRLRLWLRLLTCVTEVEQEIRRRLRAEFGTTLPRFDLMAALARAGDGGMTMGELSRRLMVSGGNITGLVDRLADEGLVRRSANPRDRRSSHVALSEAGREAFGDMAAAHAGWVCGLLDGLSEKDIDALMDLLAKTKRSVAEDRRRAPSEDAA